MRATLGHDQRFEFESDQNLITLDIPPAGTITRDEAWRIIALGPPVVGLAFTTFLIIKTHTNIYTCTEMVGVVYTPHL